MTKRVSSVGVLLAILAAALYALNAPLSKLLLDYMPSTVMAGFLYLGAGLGMLVIACVRRLSGRKTKEAPLTRAELPFVTAMILLDVAAPILLLLGLKTASASSVSLLGNFEIVTTALIALLLFKETVSPRLWMGILFVTASCALLSFDGAADLRFSAGSLFVLLACLCWGLENNCTRKLSTKDPLTIVLLKGMFSGTASVLIGFAVGERVTSLFAVLGTLLLGFVAYGMSIFFYVYAQRRLGAARTGAYYAIAPFIGVTLSLILFRELPAPIFFVALVLMAVGAFLSASDMPLFKKQKRTKDKAP